MVAVIMEIYLVFQGTNNRICHRVYPYFEL